MSLTLHFSEEQWNNLHENNISKLNHFFEKKYLHYIYLVLLEFKIDQLS